MIELYEELQKEHDDLFRLYGAEALSELQSTSVMQPLLPSVNESVVFTLNGVNIATPDEPACPLISGAAD